MKTQRLDILQLGRGLAALAVVVSHAQIATHDFIKPPPPGWVSYFLSQGWLGVDFFFVLSGFIILQVHQHDDRTSRAARTYLRKRALRIYIPYLPVGVAMALAYTLAPGLSDAPRSWGLLTSLTLFPTEHPPALAVAWTLVHEVTFYAIFLLFYATRRFAWLIGGWTVALMVVAFTHPKFGGFFGAGLVKTVLDPINLEFVFGMAACWAWPRLAGTRRTALLCIGAALAGVFVLRDMGSDYRVLFGLGMSMIIAPLVSMENEGRLSAWKPLVVLGDASYAIYLTHSMAVSIAIRFARTERFSWWLALLFCVGAGVAIGFAYNRLFENPARRFFARRTAAANPTVARPAE